MSAGYGRGYYGVEQLASEAPRPRMSTWFKIALAGGVGAVVWFMWPRAKPYELEYGGDAPKVPPLPGAPEGPLQVPLAVPMGFSEGSQLTQEALGYGYPSQQAYEDAIVSNARQLQETGATVVLAPHLQHLMPRLGTRA